MDTERGAPEAARRSAGVVKDNQTAIAVGVGRVRDFLQRYPWAPHVVMAASDVLLARQAHRRGRHVAAMVHAGNAGYNVAMAVAKAQAKARRDAIESAGLDPDQSFRGPRQPGELEIDFGPA